MLKVRYLVTSRQRHWSRIISCTNDLLQRCKMAPAVSVRLKAGSHLSSVRRYEQQVFNHRRNKPNEMPVRQRCSHRWEDKTVRQEESIVGRSVTQRHMAQIPSRYYQVKVMAASHTRYRALGPELILVYRQSARRWLLVIRPAVGCHYFPPGLRLPSHPQSITNVHRLASATLYCLVTEAQHVNNLQSVVAQLCLE